MAFFDKLNEMAKNVGDKTGDMLEVSKLNSQISDAEKRILVQKKAIGEYCWTQYIANIQLDPEVARMCASIKEDEALIATTQAEIRSIKAEKAAAPVVVEAGMLLCQECGTPNPEGTKFCQECGKELEAPIPAVPTAVVTCPACGSQNPVGTHFCQECGQDMEAVTDISEPQPVAISLPEKQEVLICPACGAVNNDENRFCSECGTTLPSSPADISLPEEPDGLICPACGAVNNEENRFCSECGTPLPSSPADNPPHEESTGPKCTVCGALNTADHPFCLKCGTQLFTPEPHEDSPRMEKTAPLEESGMEKEELEHGPEPDESAAPTAAALICPACGTVNRPGVKFCGECGARLEE